MNMGAADLAEMSVISESPVILTVPIQDDCRCILYIFTPHELRGQGRMRKMFETYMQWADDNDMRLLLLLSPDEDTDEGRLKVFYEEQGFDFGEAHAIQNHGLRLSAKERLTEISSASK